MLLCYFFLTELTFLLPCLLHMHIFFLLFANNISLVRRLLPSVLIVVVIIIIVGRGDGWQIFGAVSARWAIRRYVIDYYYHVYIYIFIIYINTDSYSNTVHSNTLT